MPGLTSVELVERWSDLLAISTNEGLNTERSGAPRRGPRRISAAEFAQQIARFMTDDVTFWSNYVPSYEPLRPLFAPCHGIDEIISRYDYENENEVIEDGSGVPYDLSISGAVIYYTQDEAASIFDQTAVTWSMVTKLELRDQMTACIRMFVDPAPIEEAYGGRQV